MLQQTTHGGQKSDGLRELPSTMSVTVRAPKRSPTWRGLEHETWIVTSCDTEPDTMRHVISEPSVAELNEPPNWTRPVPPMGE